MNDPTTKRRLQKLVNYPDFPEYMLNQLRNHPDNIEAYLEVAIEDFEKEKNMEAFLLALRTIAEAKDTMTELTRQALYKALSPKGNPRLETVWSILNALGYSLSIRPTHAERIPNDLR